MRVTDEQARSRMAGWDEGGLMHDLAADLLDARAEVERLRARVGELEEGLRLFAPYYKADNSTWAPIPMTYIESAARLLDGAK
jgi:hypothetical protein